MTKQNDSAPDVVELQPCPFCSSKDVELRVSITDACVVCNNCGCRTGIVQLGPDAASEAWRKRHVCDQWNTRTARHAAQARREALEDAAAYIEGKVGVIPAAGVYVSLIVGGNQPCMSGDMRDMLNPHVRRQFDDCTRDLAQAIRAKIGEA